MEQIDLNNLSISQTELLNDIYDELIDNYHKSIESIYDLLDKKSINWYLSTILSRNHNLSNLFMNLCYLELTKIIVKENNIIVVKCRSIDEKKIIKQYFKNIDNRIEIEYEEKPADKLKRYMAPYIDFLRNIKISLRELYYRDKNRKLNNDKENEIIIIDTFLIQSMFDNGNYYDRYYPGLIDSIDKKTKKKVYFCPTILIKNGLNNYIDILKKAKINFIYKFDYLKISDYLIALFMPFFNNKLIKNKIFFNEFDISKIVRNEYYQKRFHSSTFLGILNYLFIKRLKENNIKIILAIDWFENQPIDKGFNLGLKKYYPKSEIIGYQGFILSYKYNLHLLPIMKEVSTGLIPKQICVIGDNLIPIMKKFCTTLDVKSAPAFRFSYLHNNNSLRLNDHQNNYRILIALPISITKSYNIIKFIIELYENIDSMAIRWLIKPHPSLDVNKLKLLINKWPEKFELTYEKFSKCISRSSIMIGSTSSTSVEAIAYGVPVIIIESFGCINQNPIPESIPKTIWDICYTVEGCIDLLNKLLFSADYVFKEDQNKIGKEVIGGFFKPITNENVTSFISCN